MRIGLAGPVRVRDLRPWLSLDDGAMARAPTGMGATPVTLLARALLRRGYDVTIVTLDPAASTEVVLEGPQLRVCLGPYRWQRRGRDGYRHERRYLEQALRRERPDLVHAHWSYEYSLAALASNLPTLVTVHDWAPTILRMMPDGYRLARLLMNVKALAAAPCLTTVSPYLAGRLHRWHRPLVSVVPNGLEDEAFGTADRPARPDEPVLVAVNDGFTGWKNVTSLLQAHRLLRRDFPACRLVLVGTDHQPDGPAQRWAGERGLTDGVEFRGPVPYTEVQPLLAQADVFVHPSLEESFGMAVLEAMAQGLPVVGGERSGAVPWLLAGGHAGQLTDVRQPSAIARAVGALLADGGRQATLGRAAYERAWERFRMDRVVEGYLAAYQEVGGAVGSQRT